MAQLSMEATKLKLGGEELKKISTDYTNLIVELYEKINNLPESGIWQSDSEKGSAKVFVNAVQKDKTTSLNLGNTMKKLGSEITNYAESIENISQNTI